jgi:hypothetical protein
MTRKSNSDINYLGINENFPVPGQDNDTQVFRDNFDTIKNSLREAQSEITDLLVNSAKLDEDNDFSYYTITRAVLQNNLMSKFDAGIITAPTAQTTIDYENGNYQIFRFSTNMAIDFQNLPNSSSPTDPRGVGKITLELYGDGSARTLTFITSGGTELRRNPAFPAPLVVSSSTAPIIVEVWQHNATYIFMNYLGQFS